MFTGRVLFLKLPPTEITLIERYSGKDLPTEEKASDFRKRTSD